jgi:Zn-dependent protease with chaperone function
MRARRLGVPCILALLLIPCVHARVEPSHGFDLFSTQEEIQAGQQAAAEVKKQLPLLPESDPVSQYVQRLGHELADHAPGEKWPYTFRVVNQKDINAFALPGGPIFVNLGTIQAADNEAELAGVLAHEISHVVQRHGTRAASKQMAAQLPLAILGGIMGRGTLAQMAQLGISFGVGSYFLKNSRQAESEADLLGTDIMYDTGYDPHAMATFFEKLQEEAGRRSDIQQFFSDHPNPGNRAEAVSREVSTLPAKHNYRQDSSAFRETKRRVATMKPMTTEQIAAWQKEHAAAAAAGGTAGAVSGITPAAVMSSFSHSEYQISYPENWRVYGDQNSAVTIAPPEGISQNAVSYGLMINDYQAESSNSSLDQATHDLLASLLQSNPGMREIGHDEDIRVNGIAGKSIDLIGTSPLKDQKGQALQERDWLVSFRRTDGSLIYLVFVAPDKDFTRLRPTFEQMLKSLKMR